MPVKPRRTRKADVMISSTARDLPEHRSAVRDIIIRARMYPLAMEDTAAVAYADAISQSLRWVDEAEVYIGIFANRYGYIPRDPRNPQQISITELEYRRAKERNIPILIFIMGDGHPPTTETTEPESDIAQTKLKLLKDELKTNHIVDFFHSIPELREQVLQSLTNLVRDSIIDIYDTDDDAPEPTTPLPIPPTLYSVPPYILMNKFIGRQAELAQLKAWERSDDSIMVIEAIGGMGKSALTWHYVEKAEENKTYDGIIWWSFYEGGSTVEGFMRHALAYITGRNPEDLKEIPYNERASQLLLELRKKRYLLALDGFERVLVAYHRLDKSYIPDNMVGEDVDARNVTDPRDDGFIRQLAYLNQSKVLISTRLMPRSLEDEGRAIQSVQHIQLPGLTYEDARALMLDIGVKKADDNQLRLFLRQIDNHGLLTKLIAGRIQSYRPGQGDFDKWYRDQGQSFDLYSMTAADRQTHILHYAFEGIDDIAKQILCRIATFSQPINFQTLSIFNPYLPPKPDMPQLPPFPQIIPNPFGSPDVEWLKFQLKRATSTEEKERLQAQIAEEERNYEAKLDAMHKNRLRLEREAEKVRAKRDEILEDYRREYELSDSYLAGIRAFDSALTQLEDNGLLQWDRVNDSYDLHPLVRGYAFKLLNENEKKQIFGTIRDHFSSLPPPERENIRELIDLNDAIEGYRALIQTGEIEFAANYYREVLSTPLGLLSANYDIIELLSPFFPRGFHVKPLIEDVGTQSYIINELGLCLGRIGKSKDALKLFALNLDPTMKNHNAWSMFAGLTNYGAQLQELNQLALTDKIYKMGAEICGEQDIAWVYYDFFALAVLFGDETSANTYYQRCLDVPRPSQHASTWEIRFKVKTAEWLVLKSENAQSALADALQSAQTINRISAIHRTHYLYALYEWQHDHIDEAYHHISEAIRFGQETGEMSPAYLSLYALIKLRLGDNQEALWVLDKAINNDQILDGEKAEIYLHATRFYILYSKNDPKLQQDARNYAHKAYEYAWADGEPFCMGYLLQQAKQLLTELNEPIPTLPSTLDAGVVPYEDEIREQFIINKKPADAKPKQYPDFEITRLDWLQVGTLAFFGVNDDIIEAMSQKLTCISYFPTPYRMSRMGEEVPDPTGYHSDEEHKNITEIEWEFNELRNLTKTFIILYLQSKNSKGETVFAYVNVRGDRLKPLWQKQLKGEPFNLPDYVTIVETGTGMPSATTRDKLRRDYLFGEHYVNVRIFPPLEQALTGTSPATTPKEFEFEVIRFRKFQIGTMAVFGIEDEDLIKRLAEKITSLSDNPTPLTFSRQGEEIPSPPTDAIITIQRRDINDIEWQGDELDSHDKTFLVAYLESDNQKDEAVFAYINVRVDRLIKLLNISQSGVPFDLKDHATLILTGKGIPTQADTDKLRTDYLFNDTYLNVRIFPPLEQATQNTAPAQSQNKGQNYFELSAFTTFQVGTVAMFGIADDDLIRRMANKITRISDVPTLPLFSKMGEDVPKPTEELSFTTEKTTINDLEWEKDEVDQIDKMFSIIYIESHDRNGEPVFAFVNSRGDRIRALWNMSLKGTPFNIYDYATVIMVGKGKPNEQEQEKLQNDYLYNDKFLTIRIFPPLSDVT